MTAVEFETPRDGDWIWLAPVACRSEEGPVVACLERRIARNPEAGRRFDASVCDKAGVRRFKK